MTTSFIFTSTPKTDLPTQVDILEDDPLEGDSSYVLRYGDWRKSGTMMLPYSLRTELNGKAVTRGTGQIDPAIISPLPPNPFAIPPEDPQ